MNTNVSQEFSDVRRALPSDNDDTFSRVSIISTHSLPQFNPSNLKDKSVGKKKEHFGQKENNFHYGDSNYSDSNTFKTSKKTEKGKFAYFPRTLPKTHKSAGLRVYNFLDRPTGWKCFLYHFAVFLLVLMCLILSVLTTIPAYIASANNILSGLEIVLVIVFGCEYIIRLWSCGCRSQYMGIKGRLKFAVRPIAIIDLIVLISSITVLAMGLQSFAAAAIRGIRFIQILRILHVDRHGGTWKLLGSVVYNHRQELITSMYIGFLGLIFSSYFVFIAENAGNPNTDFLTYADALWWGIVTVTTVGYGDKIPTTWYGRLVASCLTVVTISFFALPAGILGSGFALKVQQKQREKHFNRQIPAAATVIQTLWRYYCTHPDVKSVATWMWFNEITKSSRSIDKSGSNIARRNTRILKISATKNFPEDDTQSFCEIGLNLTDSQKVSIRVIRKIRFFVAKRKFQQARQPYDVKDVIEQYSHGQMSIIMRLKEFQRRIEAILGKTNQTQAMKHKGNIIGRIQALDIKMSRIDDRIRGIQDEVHKINKEVATINSTFFPILKKLESVIVLNDHVDEED